MPLETPTPDGVLELFRDEIVPREAPIDDEYQAIARAQGGAIWDNPSPGVETLATDDGPTLIRVTFKRTIGRGGFEEADRVRHELRQLWNGIRESVPPDSQVELVPPRVTHVDRPGGLEVICYTHGLARGT